MSLVQLSFRTLKTRRKTMNEKSPSAKKTGVVTFGSDVPLSIRLPKGLGFILTWRAGAIANGAIPIITKPKISPRKLS